MSSKIQRAGILTITAIFVISTIGIGVFYVIDAQNQKKQNDQIQAAIEQAQNPANKEGTLQGTQLQNFTPSGPISALKYEDTVVGTGQAVRPSDTVTVHYTGALASNGKIFESSYDSGQTATFPLSGVIKGWTDGLPGMKVGGTRRLFIPANLAYGEQANAVIPANSDLVFDVTLVSIN